MLGGWTGGARSATRERRLPSIGMTLARLKHLLPLALLIAGLVALWVFGLRRDLSWASLSRHQAELLAVVAAHPIEAGAAYVAIYAITVACSLPEGALVTIAGGLLFGPALGGVLAIIGASTGAVILFLAARYAFADLVAARAAPFMARIRPGIERDGFLYLLALRLVPVFPFWLLNLVAAACGMRLLPFTLATVLGIIPGTFVYAWVGAGLADVLAAGGTPDFAMIFSPRILLPLLALATLTLVPVAWRAVRPRNANGRQAGGRHAEGRKAKGRTAEGCHAEGHDPDGRNAEGRNAKGRNAKGRNA
jgi:uncharacterized membrane protein YdjX (TVP38/TMEM64 family)